MSEVILVHGMWSHPGVLEPLRAYLSNRGHRVHVPLLPGHDPAHRWGKDLLSDLSVLDLADAVERFMDENEFEEPPVLVGHSMGGLVAQIVADRRTVSGLALLNSAGPRGVNHIYPVAVLATLNVLVQPLFWRRTHRPVFPIARFGLLNRVPFEVAREIHASLVCESGRCFFELVFWFLDKARTTEVDPETINAPVLVVSSGRDRIIHPRVGMALRRRYPNCEYQHFLQSGHWLCHEAGSNKVFRELESWIATATSRQSGSSIGETDKLHHDLPRLSLLPSSPISPQRSPGFRRFLDSTRSLRRSTAKNAATDRGTVLPRQTSARHGQRSHSHQRFNHSSCRGDRSLDRHG